MRALAVQNDADPGWAQLAFFVVSLLGHAAVLLTLFEASPTPLDVSSVARFSGTTFEIEAVHDDTHGLANYSPEAENQAANAQAEVPRAGDADPAPSVSSRSQAAPEPVEVSDSDATVGPPATSPETAVSPGPETASEGSPEPRSDDTSSDDTGSDDLSAPSDADSSPAKSVDPFDFAPTPQVRRERVVPDARPSLDSSGRAHQPRVSSSGRSPDSAQPAPGGAYGQAELPPGVVHLRSAFTKALPLAAKSDPAWLELPLGWAGSIEIELKVGKDHRLDPIEVVQRPRRDVPTCLLRMVRINRNFLMNGRFAVDTTGKVGKQRLRIVARVLQTDADAERPEAPGVNRLGVIGSIRPTGAYFTYYSGRRVELHVEAL